MIGRNPNDPGPSQGLHQKNSQTDRNRLKNIEWTPYETVHKKYLSLGTFYDYSYLHLMCDL